MEAAGYRGRPRRQEPKGKAKEEKKISHFRNVHFGGLDKNQTTYCLRDTMRPVEAARDADSLTRLRKQLRSQVWMKIRHYFVKRRRRNVRVAFSMATVIIYIAVVFGCLIEVDKVSGSFMYSYSDHGGWTVCSRIGEKYQGNEVIAFEKNGGSMMKRIAGLPGDRMELDSSESRAIVDGQEVQEDYVTLSDVAVGDKNEKAKEPPGMT